MYVKLEGSVARPYSLNQLRSDNPNTSFPAEISAETLMTYDVHLCIVESVPSYNEATHFTEAGEIEKVDGGFVQRWNVTAHPLPVAASNVRSLRNAEISACDWTQAADSPVDKEAWKAYRKELRDIPKQPGFPYDVSWPKKPG